MSTSVAGDDRRSSAVATLVAWLVALWGLGGLFPAQGEPPAARDNWTLIETLTASAAQDLLGQLPLPAGATVHLVAETEHPANWLVERALAERLTQQGYAVVTSPESKRAPTPGPAAVQQPSQAAPAGGTPAAPPVEPETPPAGEGQEITRSEDGGLEGSGADSTKATGEQGQEGQAPEESAAQRRAREKREQQAAAAAPATGGAQATPATTPPAPSPAVSRDLLALLPAEGEVLLYRVAELELAYPWVKRSWLIGPRQYGRLATVRLRASHLSEPGHRVAGVAQGDRVAIDEFPGWSRPYLEGTGYPFQIKQPEQKSIKRFVEPVLVTAVVGGLVYLFHENQK